MVGKVISHYRILEKTDTGDTGEVYKAAVPRIECEEAIKFFRQHLASRSKFKE